MVQSPAKDAFQVLDWIMSRHVHEYLDVAGRPIGEGRAAAFQSVSTEMQSCPYAGSRHHHSKPMNVSALRNIMPVWNEILTMLSWLSQRYRAWRKKEITSFDDLSLVTSAGVFLADFLVLRQHHPLQSHDIPLLISGLYKACLGFQLATFLGSMKERFAGDLTTTPLPDSAEFYDYLEAHELLIGDAEVCSGSAAMIMEAYDAILDPLSIAPESMPVTCARLEIDWEQFDVFVHHAANIWNELVLFVIETPRFCPELADSRLPPEVQHRLNNELKAQAAQLLAGQKGLVIDIARAAGGYCGLPGDWRSELPGQIGEPPRLPDGSLAEIVLAWLNEMDRSDMQIYGQVVASALHAQLAAYDRYETTVLGQLNEHLNYLMPALGLGCPILALPASALSHVCGRTLRDWGADS
jgi:hypothetical protein